jgi:hypothetical protein
VLQRGLSWARLRGFRAGNGGAAIARTDRRTVYRPYATVFQHLNPLASRAAVARDRPRASLVRWITEVVGFRDPFCDGRSRQPALRQAQRR